MKMFFVLVSAMLSFDTSASDYTYNCQQHLTRSPIDPAIGKISVTVKHLKQLQTYGDYRGQYVDSVDEVLVTVKTKKGNATKVLKTTKAVALSEDVMFNIENNGINFHLYMDEMDEAGINFKMNGKKVDVSLICE